MLLEEDVAVVELEAVADEVELKVEVELAVELGEDEEDGVPEDDGVKEGVISGASQQAPISVSQQGTSSSVPVEDTCTQAVSSMPADGPLGSFIPHSVAPCALATNDTSETSASMEYGGPQPQPTDEVRSLALAVVADSPSQIPQPSSETDEPDVATPQLLRTTNWASLPV